MAVVGLGHVWPVTFQLTVELKIDQAKERE